VQQGALELVDLMAVVVVVVVGVVAVVVVVAPSQVQARHCPRYEPAAALAPDKRMTFTVLP
jgi:NADH:ubiquinone oxidoreductase subunit 3 (subunit A)